MKKLINRYKGFVLFALALAPLFMMAAGGDNVEKKRTINKKYTVGPNDRLDIENSFGDVTVTTWDKDEIQVDVEIGVRANNESNAQKMLDQIEVDDKQFGGNISFRTEIGRMGNNNKYNNNENNRKFYIDYKVSMPSRNRLRIENQFGKINIPDFTGVTELTSKFGELTTGRLTNSKQIHVEFGKADIGPLNDANVVFKFNSASTLRGVSGNSKVNVEFCGNVNIVVDNATTQLSVVQSYSSINLQVTEFLSARYDIYTNFGDFENKTDFHIAAPDEDESSGPKFDKKYSGQSGTGTANIKVKSSFGTVRLSNERMVEKAKTKAKHKSGDKDADDEDDNDKSDD